MQFSDPSKRYRAVSQELLDGHRGKDASLEARLHQVDRKTEGMEHPQGCKQSGGREEKVRTAGPSSARGPYLARWPWGGCRGRSHPRLTARQRQGPDEQDLCTYEQWDAT